ncbi:uncharacterized protein LOC123676533 [Harmonia axyridis]|uniref:uncharacterized protein LOC123676533 n=1 Tax=Harmonia axyridis TaxID=115357 RepID=UPI001E275FB7|nr:uncharacterized protein LOC123676533 [Harmonia axyridis]XP_045468429.1 uncharacterized protein LOC123676533 [Harmonia axyridis]
MNFEQRRPPIFPFYKLESDSSALSNEDTESVYSLQDVETDLVRDSSDTEQFGSEYEVEIEYEVDSASGSDSNSLLDTSGDSDVERDMFLAAAAAICDSTFEQWVTDVEDSDNTSSEDTSFNRTDFWTCVKCKSQKNNPLFCYCEKCFQDRKTLFPPRPKPRKPKKNKKPEAPVKLDTLRSCLKGLSQDSGLGSSQECPPLELDKIVIPDHLTGNASIPSSSYNEDDVIPSSQQNPDTDKSSPSKQVTLNDIVKSNSSRKRQASESSLSDFETKRPRWRDQKKSPKRDKSSNSISGSPTRKRKSTSCERELYIKKIKSYHHQSLPCSITHSEDEMLQPQKTISNGISASQESIDVSGKTSDLGSEISSGSGIFDKAEELHAPLVDSKEVCMFCNTSPINAGFLHGNIAHRCCCYKCAKRTWKAIKRCPMCNRKVNKVIRVY